MRKRYVVGGLVSSLVYVVVGPILTLVSFTVQGSGEEDVWPIGIVVGWIVFAGPLSLLVVASALLGEAVARPVRRAARKLLVVGAVSAVLLFGGATLLGALVGVTLTDLAFMSLTLAPGWLVAGAGPRFWWWIAERGTAVAEQDEREAPWEAHDGTSQGAPRQPL
ncbi:hypothetical protein [Promicromonospora sukumoe]